MSPKQELSIYQANKRLNIWCGAVRSGKTYSSIYKFIDFLRSGPKGDCMIIGVSRDSIQRNVIPTLYKILGFPLPTSKTMQAQLYGRTIYFVGAHDESSVRKIQGSTLACAYVDECTCIPEPFWKMLLSRISVKGAQLFATCNPESPAHFIKKQYIDRANELDLIYWNFLLDDNPALDPKYIENLKKEYTGAYYKRFILGEWCAAQGLIYADFDEDNIFDKDLHNPTYWIAGLDYGTTNATSCHIAAISPKIWPQIRIEKEYYYDSDKAGRAKTDAELADDIKTFLAYTPIRALYVDPAAASIKLELRNRDIPVVDANNDVLFGIKTMSKFIANKNLVVRKSCKNLIEQIYGYQWDPKATERGEDKPIKHLDHACDSTRYLIASAFKSGQLSHPDEELSYDQLHRKIYGDDSFQKNFYGDSPSGYA